MGENGTFNCDTTIGQKTDSKPINKNLTLVLVHDFYVQGTQIGFICSSNSFSQHSIFNHYDIYILKVVYHTFVVQDPSSAEMQAEITDQLQGEEQPSEMWIQTL